jgi:hypothetical protein
LGTSISNSSSGELAFTGPPRHVMGILLGGLALALMASWMRLTMMAKRRH